MKLINIVLCVVLTTSVATPQRRRNSRPNTNPSAAVVENSEDEILFSEDYLLRVRQLPGWRVIDGTGEDAQHRVTVVYYDRARIVRNHTNAKAWIKYVEKQDGLEQSYSLALEEYDCNKKRQRTLQTLDYNMQGRTTFSTSRAGAWDSIVPESLSEAVYRVICKGAEDGQEHLMRVANDAFAHGRQQEEKKDYASAQVWYEFALALAPKHPKILMALDRIKRKQPAK